MSDRGVGRAVTALALVMLCAGLSGCGLPYLAQSVSGHLDMMQRARAVEDWLADPATPAERRERLLAAQRLRDFAVRELALPDNASYRRFADLQRGAVVWNVVAAPALSLQLKTWCYPVAGCAGYRGFFDRAAAQALASELAAQGWEVSVYGVPAYSTLGWTNWLGGDPLLNTFVDGPEAELAALLFHELAHQVVYVPDDTAFNESYATAVERLGLQRWLRERARPEERAAHEVREARRQDFRALTRATREQLRRIYEGPQDARARESAKAEVMAGMRDAHRQLQAGRWQGYGGYDAWFARANNAALALQSAYDEFVPAFESLFRQCGGQFAAFHDAVRELARLPRDERRARLAAAGDGPCRRTG